LLLLLALQIRSDAAEISGLRCARSTVLNTPLHLSGNSGSETISKTDEDLRVLLQSVNIAPVRFSRQAAEIIYQRISNLRKGSVWRTLLSQISLWASRGILCCSCFRYLFVIHFHYNITFLLQALSQQMLTLSLSV